MTEPTPLQQLELAIQTFIDTVDDAGSPGLVTDWFLGVGYTRLDEDGDQPFGRQYAASSSPFGSVGVAKLTLADALADLGVPGGGDDDDE